MMSTAVFYQGNSVNKHISIKKIIIS